MRRFIALSLCLGCAEGPGDAASSPADAEADARVSRRDGDRPADAAPPDARINDARISEAGVADALPTDANPPDGAPPTPERTCTFPAREVGVQTVDTWRGDVERARFTVADVPDGVLRSAALRYTAYDADHPDGEGWIELNGPPRMALPADPALDNLDRRFMVDVTGRVVPGENVVEFIAFDGPDGAFFRISQVELALTGPGLRCPEPPPVEVTPHPAPAGIAAFAALAPDFPLDGTLEILSGLQRPFTTVLLDFGPVYAAGGVEMFAAGARGGRAPNPAHLEATRRFAEAFVRASPAATERHLQLYLLNGPGIRRDGYRRAYALGPQRLDRALREDAEIRAELSRYIAALAATLRPLEALEIRLVVGLEDNFTQETAASLVRLARDAGWSGPVGRNPCGCGFGDVARAGDFHEDHPHGLDAFDALPGALRRPDSVSNDGWGWTIPADGRLVDDDAVVAMARRASATGLWFHLWYDPSQGYPVPAEGPRRLRFDHPPPRLRALLQQGLRVGP